MFLTETLIACAVAVVAALAVARFRPQDRATLWSTLLVALAGLLSLGVALAAQGVGLPMAAQVLQEAGVIALGIALIRLLSLLAFRVLFPRLGVQAPRIAEDIVATIGYVAWAVVRLRVAGVDFAGIVTASAVITAVIAFSMQDTLGNILGGIALQLDESLQIGDWIKVDELSGRVTEVRWRSTSVATRNGEIVVLPNSVLMKNRFLVLGRRDEGPPQWRRWIRFEAPGDVPPARVIDAVGDELRGSAIAGVSADPAPDCLLMGLDGGLCQYAVRYWLTDLQRDDGTDSRVRVHVHAALRRANIALALPQYRLRTINEDAAFEATRSRRETERRIDALRGAELFRGLTDEERETLAARLVYAPYAAGDMVTRKGAVAHWLYIITRGQARVSIDLPDGSQREVNLLGAGDFFGEMALMTGAPRRANVSAATDLECYRLDKQSFADLIHARPTIADEVSHVLAERQAALEALQRGVAASPQQVAHQRNELLEKVRRFFSIGED